LARMIQGRHLLGEAIVHYVERELNPARW
jgi:hypothetical protein